MTDLLPAPWRLTGKGYILIYRFHDLRLTGPGSLPSFFEDKFVEGFGALMLVDYSSSNAGPYIELLFIPGRFLIQGRRFYSITSIYVSTEASLINGRRNWGIPKMLAQARFEKTGKNRERLVMHLNNRLVADITLSYDRPVWPLDTRWLPFKFELAQAADRQLFFTRPGGRGRAGPAKIVDFKSDPELFPDLSGDKPWLAFKIDPFELVFPLPRIHRLDQNLDQKPEPK